MENTRYLFKNTSYRCRETEFDHEEVISDNSTSFNDEEFLRFFRMTREQARNLVTLLQEISRFKEIDTRERHLLFQSLVFLYRVGQEGKTGSDSKVSRFFKIGKGTIRKYVRNVMRSLLELKDQFLCWPEREERAEISSRILVEFGFPNCVGSWDNGWDPYFLR